MKLRILTILALLSCFASADPKKPIQLTIDQNTGAILGTPTAATFKTANAIAPAVTGTSGGVVYFTSGGAMASSGEMSLNQLMLGGGAGATPTSLASGTTSQLLVGGGSGVPVWTTATGTGAPVRATGATVGGLTINTSDLITSLTLHSGASFTPETGGTVSLGDTTHGFLSLYLASGGGISFGGDVTMVHDSGSVVVGGDLRVDTAGTNAASVVTVGGSQSLLNKKLGSLTTNGLVTTTSSDGSLAVLPVSANVTTLLGAANYAAFRSSLGVAIGADVQAFDADLTTYAGTTPGTSALAQYIAPALYLATTTAGATTDLSATSETIQRATGTNEQTYTLPSTSTLTVGRSWLFLNDSTKNVDVNTSTSASVKHVQPGQSFRAVCISTASNAASAWRVCDVSGSYWSAATKTAGQVFTAGAAPAAITWPVNTGGSSTFWSGGTGTAPSTGKLSISLSIQQAELDVTLGDSQLTYAYLWIEKNGVSTQLGAVHCYYSPDFSGSKVLFEFSITDHVLDVTKGDVIKILFALDTSGGTETIGIGEDGCRILVQYKD